MTDEPTFRDMTTADADGCETPCVICGNFADCWREPTS